MSLLKRKMRGRLTSIYSPVLYLQNCGLKETSTDGTHGFELARERRKRLTSVDKANILATSRLWREIAGELAAEYKDVAFDNQLVDSMAMQHAKWIEHAKRVSWRADVPSLNYLLTSTCWRCSSRSTCFCTISVRAADSAVIDATWVSGDHNRTRRHR